MKQNFYMILTWLCFPQNNNNNNKTSIMSSVEVSRESIVRTQSHFMGGIDLLNFLLFLAQNYILSGQCLAIINSRLQRHGKAKAEKETQWGTAVTLTQISAHKRDILIHRWREVIRSQYKIAHLIFAGLCEIFKGGGKRQCVFYRWVTKLKRVNLFNFYYNFLFIYFF